MQEYCTQCAALPSNEKLNNMNRSILSPPKQYFSLIQLISMTSFFSQFSKCTVCAAWNIGTLSDQSMEDCIRWNVLGGMYLFREKKIHSNCFFSYLDLFVFFFTVEKSFVLCEHRKDAIITKMWYHPKSMLHQPFNPLPFGSILSVVIKPQCQKIYFGNALNCGFFFAVMMLNAVYNQLCLLCLRIKCTVCCMRCIVMHIRICPKVVCDMTSSNQPQTSNVRHIFATNLCGGIGAHILNCSCIYAKWPECVQSCTSHNQNGRTKRNYRSFRTYVGSIFHSTCVMWSLTQRTHHTNLRIKSNQIKHYRRIQRFKFNYQRKSPQQKSRMCAQRMRKKVMCFWLKVNSQ